jgi:D-glycero-beta-D-manno-heptose 1-phosphate adenylyltransferase
MADHKIVQHPELLHLLNKGRMSLRPLVFTNGVFDILHAGHVAYLQRAKQLGAALLVAVNTDASASRLGKGPDRPINTLQNRMKVLAALECVDLVTWFNQDTPLWLIEAVRPQILVKGGDYDPRTIVGSDFVRGLGGMSYTIDVTHDLSTTALINRIRASSPVTP